MRGIGGNLTGIIQVKTVTKNEIGAHETKWVDVQSLRGWLDMSGGRANYNTFNAKIQESTHLFIGDYVPLEIGIDAETARMVIKGKVYDIMLIDNPMEMGAGSQWEIYLKYTGGQ